MSSTARLAAVRWVTVRTNALSLGARAAHHKLIVEMAARNRLPAVYTFSYFAAIALKQAEAAVTASQDVESREPKKISQRPNPRRDEIRKTGPGDGGLVSNCRTE
jgi:hypothetical protein